jgi:probable phosphoglycerate mutase
MGSLLLARHSITAASAGGRNLGQSADPPLTDAGRVLAERLGQTVRAELQALPLSELRLVSSPARRCLQTMAAIVRALAEQGGIGGREYADPLLERSAGLLELDYGSWEGLSPEECSARDPELRAAWDADPYATRTPGGESGADVAARAFRVLDELEAWLAADRGRCAVVVAHNHVNRLRLCALFSWPMRDYRRRVRQDPAGYSLVTFGAELPIIRRVNAPPGPAGGLVEALPL